MKWMPISHKTAVPGGGGYPMRVTLRDILRWVDLKRGALKVKQPISPQALAEDLNLAARAARNLPTWDKGD